MHITNKKLSFDIFTVDNNYMEHNHNILMIFDKIKMYNFDPYNVLLAIATNIPQRLKTLGHIYSINIDTVFNVQPRWKSPHYLLLATAPDESLIFTFRVFSVGDARSGQVKVGLVCILTEMNDTAQTVGSKHSRDPARRHGRLGLVILTQ